MTSFLLFGRINDEDYLHPNFSGVMFLAWRCLYAEIQRSRADDTPLQLQRALTRTIDMIKSRLTAYGEKWQHWVRVADFTTRTRAIPTKHCDKGMLQHEQSGEYYIAGELEWLWESQRAQRVQAITEDAKRDKEPSEKKKDPAPRRLQLETAETSSEPTATAVTPTESDIWRDKAILAVAPRTADMHPG